MSVLRRSVTNYLFLPEGFNFFVVSVKLIFKRLDPAQEINIVLKFKHIPFDKVPLNSINLI